MTSPSVGHELAVRARGLTRTFGEGVGVHDLDLDVDRGTIFGFIGLDMRTVLDTISDSVAKSLRMAGAAMPDDELRIASELLVRLSTSLLQTGSGAIDLSDDAAIAELGEKFFAKLVW